MVVTRATPENHARALKTIPEVALPPADPVTGKHGALMRLWDGHSATSWVGKAERAHHQFKPQGRMVGTARKSAPLPTYANVLTPRCRLPGG
jgi:hypothetical protein